MQNLYQFLETNNKQKVQQVYSVLNKNLMKIKRPHLLEELAKRVHHLCLDKLHNNKWANQSQQEAFLVGSQLQELEPYLEINQLIQLHNNKAEELSLGTYNNHKLQQISLFSALKVMEPLQEACSANSHSKTGAHFLANQYQPLDRKLLQHLELKCLTSSHSSQRFRKQMICSGRQRSKIRMKGKMTVFLTWVRTKATKRNSNENLNQLAN